MQLRRDPETILAVLGTLGAVFFAGVGLLLIYA